jgi:hypothetical protein
MFDLPYRRWLDAVHIVVIGAGAYIANSPKAELGLVGGLLAASGFVMIAGNEWGCMVNKSKELSPDQRLVPESELRAIGAAGIVSKQPAEQKPRLFLDGKPAGFAYNQTLAPVKVDYEREFCKTLVGMKEVSGKMDISETYWLKGGHWEKINPQLTPSDFKQMRNKFEYYKIIAKKGTADNSPYIVLNEGAIELRAAGRAKFPSPPGM